MEVGIRKGRSEGPESTLLIYDHSGEYTLSKKPGGWYTAYTLVYPQYTTALTLTLALARQNNSCHKLIAILPTNLKQFSKKNFTGRFPS